MAIKLPHITHVQSGANLWDPMYEQIFEVQLFFPNAAGVSQEDSALLSEQIISISGLDALSKTSDADTQNFQGVSVSYLKPKLSNTYADLKMEINLNIRNGNDALVYKGFKAWAKLNYDIASGSRSLMADYVSDGMIINEANRDGQVWRKITFHKMFLTKISGLDKDDYGSDSIRKLSVEFRADYWDEDIA